MNRKIELTRFEKESRDVLRIIHDRIRPGRPRKLYLKSEWYELMDLVKQAIDHLDWKESGCPMGLHRGDCTCERMYQEKTSTGLK